MCEKIKPTLGRKAGTLSDGENVVFPSLCSENTAGSTPNGVGTTQEGRPEWDAPLAWCRWRGSTRVPRKRATRCSRPKKRKSGDYIGWRERSISLALLGKYGGFDAERRRYHAKGTPRTGRPSCVVPVAGVEPARGISPKDFESSSSANSNTPACSDIIAQETDKVKAGREKTRDRFSPFRAYCP